MNYPYKLLKPLISRYKTKKNKNYKKTILITAILLHIGIIIYNILYRHRETSIDTIVLFIGLITYYFLYDKLHQDEYSFLALVTMSILHNLKIYNLVILGGEMEHYIHIFGGFTSAIIVDRLFNKKLSKLKRTFLYIIASLGLGAIIEIIEWGGYVIKGNAPGLFGVGIGDLSGGVWTNSIIDLIFGLLGGILYSVYILIKTKKRNTKNQIQKNSNKK